MHSFLLSDLSFRALEKALDVRAMLPPQQGRENDRQFGHERFAQSPQHERRGGGGDERGQRRVPADERNDQPEHREGESHHGFKAEKTSDESRDAFAALEVQPDGKEMANEG